jgi:hypothetical protein
MGPNHICYSKIALDSSKPVGPGGPTGCTSATVTANECQSILLEGILDLKKTMDMDTLYAVLLECYIVKDGYKYDVANMVSKNA